MCMKTTKDVVIKQGKERDRQGDQSYISRNMVGLTKRCIKNKNKNKNIGVYLG